MSGIPAELPTSSTWLRATLLALVPPIVGIAVLLLLWWLAMIVLEPASYVLPPPDKVLGRLLSDRTLLIENAITTGKIAIYGLFASTIVGVAFGFIIARWQVMRAVLMPPIVAIQSIPKVALAPLFIVWFGFGAMPKILVAVLVTFFPLLLATVVGVDSVSRNTVHLARSMGCRSTSLLRFILMPSAAPHIAAAFRLAATLALVGALVAEFVGSTGGLGNVLLIASGNRDTELAFATILVTAGLGIALYSGAVVISNLATRTLNPAFVRSVA